MPKFTSKKSKKRKKRKASSPQPEIPVDALLHHADFPDYPTITYANRYACLDNFRYLKERDQLLIADLVTRMAYDEIWRHSSCVYFIENKTLDSFERWQRKYLKSHRNVFVHEV